MTRPTRFLVLLTAVGVFSFAAVLVAPAVLVVLFLTGLAMVTFMLFTGPTFFIGRLRMRQKRWLDAIACFDAFERSKWSKSPLFLGMYTFNGRAISRNNRGVALMNAGRIDGAREALLSALFIDAQYAVPHVNLALLAALGGDAATADAETAVAARLGYRVGGLQKKVRALLAATNIGLGAAVTRSDSSGPA